MAPPSHLVRWACLALAAIGCSFGGEPPPATRVDTVRFRLGGEQFGGGSSRAVAQIGDEARSVVVAPELVLAAEVPGVRLEDGRLRAPVTLAPETVGLPDPAFVLTLQTIPEAVASVPAAQAAFLASREERLVDRFELIRESPAAARAEIVHEPATALESTTVNLRLKALMPIATSLESEPFDVPDGARLELGFGLAQLPVSSQAARVRFAARLACAGTPDAAIVDRELGTGDDAGSSWHDATLPLPAGRRCRLALDARSLTDDAVRGAVWSVPRVVAPGAVPPAQAQSLVLVSLDTLRADHLSGYGYPRETSPTIDAEMIARGTTFTDASTTFPRTDIAHLSLFTGLFPGAMPVQGRLAASVPIAMLAEVLRDAGFETAAFTEDALVAGSFGFWFGFDRFVERAFDERHRGERTFADAARYVAEMRDRRFFLFLHTYKTHDPYVSSEGYAHLFRDARDDLAPAVPPKHRDELDAYDRAVREADALLGGFLAELERLGLADRTSIVLLSDHGEAFGEHRLGRHGLGFQQEQIHVPLVFRGPGIPAGERVATPVSLVDVAPTVLDLLGVEGMRQAQGASLAPAFAGRELPTGRPVFFSWMGAPDSLGMRLGKVKAVRAAGRYQVFDLADDPGETRPRVAGEAERGRLEPLLGAHDDAVARRRDELADAASAAPGGGAPIPQRIEDSLRALGYL